MFGRFKCPNVVIREKKFGKLEHAEFHLYLVNNSQPNTVKVHWQYFYYNFHYRYAIIKGIDLNWLRNLKINLKENENICIVQML